MGVNYERTRRTLQRCQGYTWDQVKEMARKKKEMAYDLEIKPLATIEAMDAYDYYESMRPGLGEDFFTEVEAFY